MKNSSPILSNLKILSFPPYFGVWSDNNIYLTPYLGVRRDPSYLIPSLGVGIDNNIINLALYLYEGIIIFISHCTLDYEEIIIFILLYTLGYEGTLIFISPPYHLVGRDNNIYLTISLGVRSDINNIYLSPYLGVWMDLDIYLNPCQGLRSDNNIYITPYIGVRRDHHIYLTPIPFGRNG